MGYRMTVINPENRSIIVDSKLYGYITEDEMRQCKSLQWLLDHKLVEGYDKRVISPYNPDFWDYGYYNTMYLSKEQYEEFIPLYVEDRSKFYCRPDYPDDVEKYLCGLQWVKIEWW